jgi:internalin A
MKRRYLNSVLIFLFLCFLSCESKEEELARKYSDFIYKNSEGQITVIEITKYNLDDISFLSKFNKLYKLHIASRKVKDISPLKDLTDLEELTIWGLDNQIKDLNPLEQLTKLKYLFIGENRVIDIKGISSLNNVNEIYFYGKEITDIKPIEKLTNLKILTLNCYKLSDISPLASLINLERLEITYSNELVDISPIRKLINLKYLSLIGCKKINAQTALFIKDMKNLKDFYGANDAVWEIINKYRPELRAWK